MSNSAPRTALRGSIAPCVQRFGHLQHRGVSSAAAASVQPLAARLLQFKPSPYASIRRRHVQNPKFKNPHPSTSRDFSPSRHFGLKMATPETFSETGSETMYEKVSSSVVSKPDVVISLVAGALGCMEFARGGPRLRARTLYAAGNPFAHALAASTAAPRAGLPYASSLTRPSLGPMSAKNLRSPRERNDERRRRRNDADAQTDDPRRPSPSSSRRARA